MLRRTSTRAATVAVLLLALLPGAARAGSIASFSVKRTQSLPAFVPVPQGFVASPLGYPAAVGPVIGLGDDGCVPPASLFASGEVTPNAVADDCDAFLRMIDGRHEDSPGAFPGLTTTVTFTGAPTKLTIHTPPGQLGNPYAAHQCSVDVELCDPNFPALSPNVDNDPTEQDGSQVGETTDRTSV